MNPLLHTEHLSVGYRTPLFSHLQLSLYPAQLTCLMGRNGAGKSTLLKSLSGLMMPLSGSVLLSTKRLTEMSKMEISKKLGIVLTQSVSVSYMTVFDLVSFGRYPYTNVGGKMSEEDIEIVKKALKFVGIEALKNRFLEELSDGERQKAALARVIAQQTELILLDEPVAFLDFPAKMEMMNMLKLRALQDQKSILITTHDIEMALTVADTLWVIDDQRNLIQGTPQTLVNDGTIARVFDTENVKFEAESKRFRFVR